MNIKITAILLLTFATAANASENHTQLLRNNVLESAEMEKPMLSLKNKFDKFGNNAALTNEQITKKSKELEGVFLSVMLEPMFPEGKESNLYGGSTGSDIFRSLMIQEYGKGFAEAGGIGLAKGIEKQMKRKAGE